MVMMMVVVAGSGGGSGGGQDVRGGLLLREEVGVHRRLVQGEGLDVCNGQEYTLIKFTVSMGAGLSCMKHRAAVA